MLNPEQIQQYRQKYKISSIGANSVAQNMAQQSGFMDRAISTVSKSGEQIYDTLAGKSGNFDAQPLESLRRGTEATATAFSTPLKLGYETLPQPAREGLSKAGEKI